MHDAVIKWKHFPRYWPFVQRIHRSRWIPRTKASDAELWCFLWRLSKQPRGWWFEMPSWSLWRHRNDVIKSISYIHYVPWIWRPFCCAFIVVVFSVLVVFVRQVPYSHIPYFLGLFHWLLNRHKPLAKCIGSDGISRCAKICDWQPYLYQETINCYET